MVGLGIFNGDHRAVRLKLLANTACGPFDGSAGGKWMASEPRALFPTSVNGWESARLPCSLVVSSTSLARCWKSYCLPHASIVPTPESVRVCAGETGGRRKFRRTCGASRPPPHLSCLQRCGVGGGVIVVQMRSLPPLPPLVVLPCLILNITS
eukprot:scaffold456_cov368-Pavlova_lutheri.AAC.22